MFHLLPPGLTIVRYVRPLTENQRHTLAEIMTHDAIPRARVRAQSILLSAQGVKINRNREDISGR